MQQNLEFTDAQKKYLNEKYFQHIIDKFIDKFKKFKKLFITELNNIKKKNEYEETKGKKKSKRCKAKNKENETKLLQQIYKDIKNKTGFYSKISKQLKDMYNKEICKVSIKGGNNQHYDLLLEFTDGSEKRCEVKKSSYLPVNKWKTPWQGGVQLLNGVGKTFRICKFYAKKWYKQNIKNRKIKNEFDLYQRWCTTIQKKNLTEFSSELKDICKKDKDKDKILKQLKNDFTKNLKVPDKDVNELICDLNQQIKEIMDIKECYLCIYKNEVKIWDKIEAPTIEINNIHRFNKSVDLLYKIDTSDINIKDIRIRWQNTIGIANISTQVK